MYKDQMRLSLCDMNKPWKKVGVSLVHNLRTGFGGCGECNVSLIDLLFQPVHIPSHLFCLKVKLFLFSFNLK